MRHQAKGFHFLVLCCVLATAWAQLLVLAAPGSETAKAGSESQFEQANRLYEQGKYREAAAVYENMIRSGWTSSGLYFNLGNACYKQGLLGRAILNYRKAAALDPRDPDIQGNLRFARDRVPGGNSVEEGPLARALGYFRLNELTWVAMFLFWIWLGLLSVMRYRPSLRPSLRSATIGTGVFTGLLILMLLSALQVSSRQTAIIIGSETAVRLGPIPESQPAFKVPAGTELRVDAQREGWIQVSDRGGRTGWLEPGSYALFPGSTEKAVE